MPRSLLDVVLSGVSWEENPLRRLLSLDTLFQLDLTPEQMLEHLGRVYRSITMYAHPDRPSVTKEQADIFRDLNAARDLLKNPAILTEAFSELRDAARKDAIIAKRYQKELESTRVEERKWREMIVEMRSRLSDKDKEVKTEGGRRKNEKIGLLLAPTFILARKPRTLYHAGEATKMATLSFYASRDYMGMGREPEELIEEALESREAFPEIRFSVRPPQPQRGKKKPDLTAPFPLDHGLSQDYRKALEVLGRVLQLNFKKVGELKAKLTFPLLEGRVIRKEDRRLKMVGCVPFGEVGKEEALYSEAGKQKGTLELEERVVADKCLPFLYETGLLVCISGLRVYLRKREVSEQLKNVASEMSLPRDRCEGCDIILRLA